MIYVFLANGFEEVEAISPIDLLRRAEKQVVTVGVGGRDITGSHGITVRADMEESEAVMDESVEMIVLPGGMPGTLNLEKSEIVDACLDIAHRRSIWIAAICAAPSILGHKGFLQGKKATCYTGFEDQLTGAQATGELVCVDGSIVTARGAGAALDFGLKLVEVLEGKERADLLSDSLLCKKG